MLRRLHAEGPLPPPDPAEMRTVRSLVRRGLLRTRDRGRDRASEPGCWFLTARAVRLVAQVEGLAAPPQSGGETFASAAEGQGVRPGRA
jgi:hypothetical protein